MPAPMPPPIMPAHIPSPCSWPAGIEVWGFAAGAVVCAMARPLPMTNARNADASEARLMM
jgi:hypothetical protein